MKESKKKKAYTINDIADLAGVSITTVSRVLNGNNMVSAKTRKKVLKIMKDVGYVPNQMARGLALNRNKIVGVLIPNILNGYYAEMASYLEPLLSEKGYSMQLCITNSEESKIDYYIDDLISRRAAGVIVLSLKIDSKELIRKAQSNMAVVVVESDVEGVDHVYVENKQGTYMAVENLIKEGHRKIGFIGYERNQKSSEKRCEGYLKALKDYGIKPDKKYIIDSIGNNPGYIGMEKLLALQVPPTAVQCVNEYCALGVYMALMEKGIAIPDEISVSAFDGQENMKLLVPSLTTIVLPIKEIAKNTVKLLFENIKNGHSEIPRTIVLPVTLRKGESVKHICG